ncbi:MAG: 30S ribosomal protein S7 [Candidatus Falkowbacteria bacterium]|nr:30S ribosomal protein S7 [Candidatus Falkowbacteria bacterium]
MRGKAAPKRIIYPDARYNDQEVSKLINYIMTQGKKAVAQKIVYDSFEIVKTKTAQDPRHIFNKALKMVSPLLEVRSRRVGGANYQIPYQVRGERRFMLACRWMIEAARARKGKPMAEKLALEIMDTANGESASVKKKLDVQRMAEANKAFAHFAR